LLPAVGGPVVVSLALIPIRDEIAPSTKSLLLVVVVLTAAIVGGRSGGAVAALVSAVSFDFFLTKPYYSFVINARDDIETAALLLLVGLLVGEIVVRSRRAQQLAFEQDRDLRRMERYAQLGAGGDNPGRLIRVAEAELSDLLELQSCWFERPPFAVTLPVFGHGQLTVWSDEWGIAALDPAPSSLVALPVFGEGQEQGRFVLDLGNARTIAAVDHDARKLAVALADRVGAALVHAR
jgi:K+-sensing histidine kinase KdpD